MEFLAFLLGLSAGILLWNGWRLHGSHWFPLLVRLTNPFVRVTLLKKSPSPPRKPSENGLLFPHQFDPWQQILDAAPLGYLKLDEENHIVGCNRLAYRLLSIDPAHIIPPRSLLQVVRSYELDELVERVRVTRLSCQQDWTFHPASPDPVELMESRSYEVRGHASLLPNYHVVVFLESRQEAIALAQQRDRWASDVAHELKTPLTSIRLVAETLQSKLMPPHRDWIDRLLSEVIRLSNLVQDLLDLGQLQQGATYSLNRTRFDLIEEIFTAWMGLEPLASARGLDIDYSGPPTLMIEADQPRISRILINLLDNGIKYSPMDAMIQVHVQIEPNVNQQFDLDKDWVSIDIIDSGPGFNAIDLPHVFERFYRSEPSRTRQIIHSSLPHPSGTDGTKPTTHPYPTHSVGLGLAIVEQIVKAHEGVVTARNHPETCGAWMQVILPIP